MARIMFKCPYLKGGSKNSTHLSNLVKYIATRDGVEVVYKNPTADATKKQIKLIEQLLKEFPNTKNLYEYEDYIKNPTIENASDFISIALEHNLDRVAKKENYVKYIANRPNAEKISSHGLFTSGDEKINLNEVAEEVANHKGNIWTPIISLRREDSIKTGFDNAETFKNFLEGYAINFASNLKIPIERFKWYASFHNESHHPHVHMVCYSTDKRYGYLTQQGIDNIKSGLVKEIFKEEMQQIYADKTKKRDELKKESEKVFRNLKYQLQNHNTANPKLEELITSLNQKLKFSTGKKQYGYLRPPLKAIVDSIVDEMANEPSIKNAYDLWCEIQNEIYSSYQDTMPGPLPLSKQKEFKSIKNMIINEVLELDSELELEQSEQQLISAKELPQDDIVAEDYPVLTDDDMPPLVEIELQNEIDENCSDFYDGAESFVAEPQESVKNTEYHVTWNENYKQAKFHLFGQVTPASNITKKIDDENNFSAAEMNQELTVDFVKALELLKLESEDKNALAIFDMARIYADVLGVEIDTEKAQELYATALSAFEEVESNKPWKYTEYRIGKMYAQGLRTESNYEVAAEWFEKSAKEQYKFAQYSLGGLYYRGQGVDQDFERAFELYLASADQDFPYAQYETAKMYRDGQVAPAGNITTKIDELDNFSVAKINLQNNEEYVAKMSQGSALYFKLAFISFENLEKQSHDDKIQYRLGAMLQKGIGTEIDIPRAKKYFEMSTKLGNTFACYSLAKLILEDKTSTAKDLETAIAYLKTASEGGNQFAQYSLAKIYLEEKYVDKNIVKALELLHQSAEQGNQFANYKLGKLYLDGEVIAKDIEKVIKHLNLSAEEKNQFAEYTLGKLYLKGEDVPKDIVKALELLQRSAEQGNEFAKYQLGVLHLKGEDVPKDIAKAILLLTEVAEQGNEFAQYQLGKLYLLGKDVPQDKETAIKWLTLSAEQGNVYAQFFIENMDKWNNPSVGICAFRMFHQLANIFEDNIPQDSTTSHTKIDSKLLRKMREKKMAQGHKISGHQIKM